MIFVKKFLMGAGALLLILWGGAGTQSSSTLLQGGGFIGLLIGLVILYIFAKMAWRAMGCLPSVIIIVGIVAFIMYAIGAFNNGVGGIIPNLKSFLGQSDTSVSAQYKVMQQPVYDEGEAGAEEDISDRQEQTQDTQQNEVENILGRLSERFGGNAAPAAPQPQQPRFPTIYGSVGVVSADTLKIQNRYFKLYGIDAPELNQKCADDNGRSYNCGMIAARWLRDWIMDSDVECQIMQQDKKGNMFGTCSYGPYDLGAAIVNAGWAVAYTKYTDIYSPYELQAKVNHRGLWQGNFYMPWDWRKIQVQKPKIKITRPKSKKKNIFGE